MAEPGRDDGGEEELHARLEKLRAALDREEERRSGAARKSSSDGSFGRALSVGLTVFSEFAGAIAIGVLIGWQADAWLGTGPLLLIAFSILGIAAGFWNIYRAAAPKGPPGGAPEA